MEGKIDTDIAEKFEEVFAGISKDNPYGNLKFIVFWNLYLPISSFVNYFVNMDIATLATMGDIDRSDTEAINAIFKHMDERVEIINLSFVLKAAK